MFEVIPLSFNCLATLILLILKLFEKGYEFDEIGYLIEIYTYFLFCYTFAVILSQVKQSTHMHKQSSTRQRYLYILCDIIGSVMLLSVY